MILAFLYSYGKFSMKTKCDHFSRKIPQVKIDFTSQLLVRLATKQNKNTKYDNT